MRTIRNLALAGAVALAPVLAQASSTEPHVTHPRIVGSGENSCVLYAEPTSTGASTVAALLRHLGG
ncbi:MAG TPA: hypothetical protein VGN83_19185 [Falsiroseomonas sp.]|nr:hypothetical protein [Falsiroseomonas sp.]